jgi:hypothetical protein
MGIDYQQNKKKMKKVLLLGDSLLFPLGGFDREIQGNQSLYPWPHSE